MVNLTGKKNKKAKNKVSNKKYLRRIKRLKLSKTVFFKAMKKGEMLLKMYLIQGNLLQKIEIRGKWAEKPLFSERPNSEIQLQSFREALLLIPRIASTSQVFQS